MPTKATSSIDNGGIYTTSNNAAPSAPGDTSTKGYADALAANGVIFLGAGLADNGVNVFSTWAALYAATASSAAPKLVVVVGNISIAASAFAGDGYQFVSFDPAPPSLIVADGGQFTLSGGQLTVDNVSLQTASETVNLVEASVASTVVIRNRGGISNASSAKSAISGGGTLILSNLATVTGTIQSVSPINWSLFMFDKSSISDYVGDGDFSVAADASCTNGNAAGGYSGTFSRGPGDNSLFVYFNNAGTGLDASTVQDALSALSAGRACAMADAQLDGSVFLQVNVSAGKIGTLLKIDEFPSLARLYDVSVGSVSLNGQPSTGNSRIDAVVWNTDTLISEVVHGAEFPAASADVLPALALAQKALRLFRVHDTDVDNTTITDIGAKTLAGVPDLVVIGNFNASPGPLNLPLSAYSAASAGSGLWFQRMEFVDARLVAIEQSDDRTRMIEYQFSPTDILNGVFYENLSVFAGKVDIDGGGQRAYKYTITAADFAGAAPTDTAKTTPTLFSVAAGEKLMLVSMYQNSPFIITAGTQAQLTPNIGAANANTVDMLQGQGLDANPVGFQGTDDLAQNIGSPPNMTLSKTAPTDITATLDLGLVPFSAITQYGELDIWIVTQKLP